MAVTINASTSSGVITTADNSGVLQLQTNSGQTAVTIDTSQNVGIGTTSPGYVLDVQNASTAGSGSIIGNYNTASSGSSISTLRLRSSGTGASYWDINTGNTASGLNGSIRFFDNIAGSERMRIDSSGNVGIGTASPSQKLDVNGTIIAGKNASSSGYVGLLGSSDTNNSGYVAYYNSAGTRLGYTGYIGTVNAYLNMETDSSSYGVRLAANAGNSALAVLRTNGQFVIGSGSVTNGTRLLAYDATGTSSTLGGFYADSTSYASSCQDIWVSRSSNSAYNFLVTRNASDTNSAHVLRGDGNGYADGTWNNNGADYAEYFESATGQPIEVGTTVVLDGNKVRAATSSDDVQTIMGVVRPKEPGIASMTIGNTAWNKWSKQYLTDDFGRYILEKHEVIEWTIPKDVDNGQLEDEHKSYESHMIPEGVVIPENATRKSKDHLGNEFYHYKLNPDFDPTQEYTPREERPEWLVIGLIGQVPILKNQPMNDRWIKMRDISTNVSEYLIR